MFAILAKQIEALWINYLWDRIKFETLECWHYLDHLMSEHLQGDHEKVKLLFKIEKWKPT